MAARETKFRAKPLENDSIDRHITVVGRDWIYGGGAVVLLNGKQAFIHLNDDGMLTVTLIAPGSLQEFTGLHDRNGKEIYEGDVARRLNTSGAFSNRFTVKWHAIDAGYRIRTVDGVTAKNLEIVGNIYDNPELLEVA